jgi:hypothetical protein
MHFVTISEGCESSAAKIKTRRGRLNIPNGADLDCASLQNRKAADRPQVRQLICGCGWTDAGV